MAVQAVGASATGTSHVAQGQPCQDAFEVVRTDGCLVACVCDGAGSAARSDEGARTLARRVAHALARDPRALLRSPDAWEQVAAAVQVTRDALSPLADLAAFHATLCGVVLTPAGSLAFHLGDGVIFGINPENWGDYLVSEPENGEFAETTYFFTLPDWRRHLRVMCAPARFRTWFLMTDGTASFAAGNQPWRPEAGFLRPVHDYLRGVPQDAGEQALQATLDDPRSHRITSDDKTLVWLHREP
ncbi:MAG TPA: PP2C family serine/threonine-protein phosphatase [Spongiibacteraceae bacterium]|nr:PP2C family serine/threonine-protein phosphatase [Spongiibacteraceae bacterium]